MNNIKPIKQLQYSLQTYTDETRRKISILTVSAETFPIPSHSNLSVTRLAETLLDPPLHEASLLLKFMRFLQQKRLFWCKLVSQESLSVWQSLNVIITVNCFGLNLLCLLVDQEKSPLVSGRETIRRSGWLTLKLEERQTKCGPC